jgi:hypothetical protein
MRNIVITTSLLLLLFNSACVQKGSNIAFDAGTLDSSIYSNSEIGWTMRIPNGWTTISRDDQAQTTQSGLEVVASATGQEIDYSGLMHLISFQKNRFNQFQSTIEPYNTEELGDWIEHNKFVYKLVYDTYENQGMKVDTSSTTDKIDNRVFQLFRMKLYGPDGNIILFQDMYTRLIKGYQFGAILNYNNSIDKGAMQKVWFESKFTD